MLAANSLTILASAYSLIRSSNINIQGIEQVIFFWHFTKTRNSFFELNSCSKLTIFVIRIKRYQYCRMLEVKNKANLIKQMRNSRPL